MSQPWPPPGNSRRYPPDGPYEMRPSPRQQGRPPPRGPVPNRGPPQGYYPQGNRGPSPSPYDQRMPPPRPQYNPHPNMPPAHRQPPPRGPGPMHAAPPRPGPGQPRYNMRPDYNYGPGPDYNQPPRKKSTPDRQADPRASQYSASVYSTNSSPKHSPEVPAVPTFADMQASLRRNNSNGRSLKRASSFYNSENPFMDNIPEHPDENRPRSAGSDVSSGQFSLYRPEKGGVVSPLDGQPKGLGGIIAGSNHDDQMEPGLIRQASFGKRQKAALTTVRHSDHKSIAPSVRDEIDEPPLPEDDFKPHAPIMGDLVPAPLSPSRSRANSSPTTGSFTSEPEKMEKMGLHDALAATAPPGKPGGSWPLRSPGMPGSGPRGALSPPKSRFSRDFKSQHQQSHSGEGGKLFLMPPQRQKSLKDRVGDKAPSSINIEAVRKAESRGSLTSLPGLLNRALQMASNLERGKTSSKHSDWFGNELLKNMEARGKSTASLNTMLDKFAFSQGADKNGDRGSSTYSEKWPRPAPLPPSGLKHQMRAPRDIGSQRSRSKYDHRNPPPARKCCGMPLWLFFVLLIAALILIVLAVVLPVALIVIPNDKKSANPSCMAKHPCQNGGASAPDPNGNCQCLCPGSFTGTNCTDSNPAGMCGNIAIPNVLPNAAIGSNLPALINSAQASYQIPLNASSILTAFSISDTNCAIQNTLVSFSSTNSGKRRSLGRRDIPPNVASAAEPIITAPPATPHHGGNAHHHFDLRQDSAITQGGLVIASGASTSPTSTAPNPGPTGTSQYTDTNHQNFAKTSILYALQCSQDLGVATTAWSKLQPYFNGLGASGGNYQSIDMGNGWTLDLQDLKVTGAGKSAGGNGNP